MTCPPGSPAVETALHQIERRVATRFERVDIGKILRTARGRLLRRRVRGSKTERGEFQGGLRYDRTRSPHRLPVNPDLMTRESVRSAQVRSHPQSPLDSQHCQGMLFEIESTSTGIVNGP